MQIPSITPVILCGGTGKRLWPSSRKSWPKQFTRMTDDAHSMLQATVLRLEGCGCGMPMLVTSEAYRFIVAEQMQEIGFDNHAILVEPAARNTAPAIAAAIEVIDEDDALLLVAPSDHHLSNPHGLRAALAAAAERALAGEIVTFGIQPDRPETGYGYIELAEPKAIEGVPVSFNRFVEKPDEFNARRMMIDGQHLWNSGMFLFTVRTMREALKKHRPAILDCARKAVEAGRDDLDFFRLGPALAEAENISIDHAVMEKESGCVVPIATGWNDLGSWRTVWQESPQDRHGVSTKGSVTAMGCQNALIRSDEPGLHVVGVGLQNIAVVATRDAVLICDMDKSQLVGEAVEEMARQALPQAESFVRHARPWGHYETLSLGKRFQVKSIVVQPGGRLSLQSHVHRAEHWVVVEGTALVQVADEERLLSENQSVYIPLGEVHRLTNPGHVPLRLIEVQTGTYLGEDDIVRYDDVYNRHQEVATPPVPLEIAAE